MRSAFFVALVSCLPLFTGCTSLKSYKVNDSAVPAEARAGSIPYALPQKTLTISATYVLTACKTEVDARTNEPTLHLDVDVTASVVGTNEVDSDERYLIPYAEIRSWLKDVSITVETYPNQTLKSLNGAITDQAGALLTATVGAAIKFAQLALVGAPLKAEDEMCDPNALRALSKVDSLKAPLDPTVQKKPSDAEAARYTKEIAKIVTDSLTAKASLVWTPTLAELRAGTGATDSATKVLSSSVSLQNWLTPRGRAFLAQKQAGSNDVNVTLEVPKWAHPATKQTLKNPINGIVLASPAIGTVRVCKGPCPAQGPNGTQTDNVLQIASGAFPQLGGKIVLPLENFFAQTSQLDLAVAEDGVVTKLGVKSASTAAASITALGANFDAARSAIEANEKAKAAAQTAAQTKARDDNKILADCLDAQDKIIAKGGIPKAKCQ